MTIISSLTHGQPLQAAAANDRLLLAARILMASLFIFSGLEKALDFQGFVAFATAGGVPMAGLLTPFIIFGELGGAALLVVGWNTRFAAAYFMIFCLVLGPWFHQFWHASPERWQEAIDGFFHHLVMAGGFMFVIVHGPGALSVDARRASL